MKSMLVRFVLVLVSGVATVDLRTCDGGNSAMASVEFGGSRSPR